jgi:hypothetical protein
MKVFKEAKWQLIDHKQGESICRGPNINFCLTHSHNLAFMQMQRQVTGLNPRNECHVPRCFALFYFLKPIFITLWIISPSDYFTVCTLRTSCKSFSRRSRAGTAIIDYHLKDRQAFVFLSFLPTFFLSSFLFFSFSFSLFFSSFLLFSLLFLFYV